MSKLNKIPRLNKKQKNEADKLAAAAIEFIQLQNREIKPKAEYGSSGLFHPAAEFGCCKFIRRPSRAYPFSLYDHARTAEHTANKFDVSATDIKKLKRLWNKYERETLGGKSTCYSFIESGANEKERIEFLINLRKEQISKFAASLIS